jgi:hypothetical protein
MHHLNSSDILINEQFYFRGAVSYRFTHEIVHAYKIKTMYVWLSVMLLRRLNQ